MKNVIIAILAAGVLTGGYIGYKSQQAPDYSYLQMENIEALSQNEGQVVDKIRCWSESETDGSRSFVDCASCDEIQGFKGIGSNNWCSKIRH